MNSTRALNIAQSTTRRAQADSATLFQVVARLMLTADDPEVSDADACTLYDAADLVQLELRQRGCSSLSFVEVRDEVMHEMRAAARV